MPPGQILVCTMSGLLDNIIVSLCLSFFRKLNRLPLVMYFVTMYGAGSSSRHTPMRPSTFGWSNDFIFLLSSSKSPRPLRFESSMEMHCHYVVPYLTSVCAVYTLTFEGFCCHCHWTSELTPACHTGPVHNAKLSYWHVAVNMKSKTAYRMQVHYTAKNEVLK